MRHRRAHPSCLVDRGWDAVGIDNVRQAVDVAVRRNGLADTRFVIGDVRHLVHSGVGTGFDLFLDVGCFQGLDEAGRTLVAGGVTELAAARRDHAADDAPADRERWPVRPRQVLARTSSGLPRLDGGGASTVARLARHRGTGAAARLAASHGEWFRLTRPDRG